MLEGLLSCTYISRIVVLGLHGGAPVHTCRHDILPGDHTTIEHQDSDVQLIHVYQASILIWTHYLFHLPSKGKTLTFEKHIRDWCISLLIFYQGTRILCNDRSPALLHYYKLILVSWTCFQGSPSSNPARSFGLLDHFPSIMRFHSNPISHNRHS